MQFLPTMATVAVVSVLVVLILGLLNMKRGNNHNLSQTIMRWRIILQFIAVVLLMATLYFTSK